MPARQSYNRRGPETDFASVNPCVSDEYNSEVWEGLNEQDGTIWEHLNDAGESGVWINEDYNPLGPVVVLVEHPSGDAYTCYAYNNGADIGEVKLPITEDSFAGPYDTARRAWRHLNQAANRGEASSKEEV